MGHTHGLKTTGLEAANHLPTRALFALSNAREHTAQSLEKDCEVLLGNSSTKPISRFQQSLP